MWADEIGRWQLQDAFQIVTPFVIAPIASKAIKNQHDMDAFLRGFTHCLFILLAATGLHFLAGVCNSGESDGADRRPRRLCLRRTGQESTYRRNCRLVRLSADHRPYRKPYSNSCAAPGVGFVARISAIVAEVSKSALRFSLSQSRCFFTPVFQERFFGEDGGTIGDIKSGEYRTAGRFEAWPELFEEVKRRPWIGAGISSSTGFVKAVWEKCHPSSQRLSADTARAGHAWIALLSLWGDPSAFQSSKGPDESARRREPWSGMRRSWAFLCFLLWRLPTTLLFMAFGSCTPCWRLPGHRIRLEELHRRATTGLIRPRWRMGPPERHRPHTLLTSKTCPPVSFENVVDLGWSEMDLPRPWSGIN